MRVALPIASDRVSPVLDVARHLLVADAEDERIVKRWHLAVEDGDLVSRARRVIESGATVLICGGVSRQLEQILLSAGVRVIANTCGPVEEVLTAFVTGRLTDDAFLMPGCSGERRRRPGGGKR